MRKILVVEDDQNISKLYSYIIKAAGYEAVITESGLTAIDTLLELDPALIISDIGMPEMDGFEFAERARKVLDGKEVKIIAITTFPLAEYASKFKKVGFDHAVQKPIYFQQGIDLVKEWAKP